MCVCVCVPSTGLRSIQFARSGCAAAVWLYQPLHAWAALLIVWLNQPSLVDANDHALHPAASLPPPSLQHVNSSAAAKCAWGDCHGPLARKSENATCAYRCVSSGWQERASLFPSQAPPSSRFVAKSVLASQVQQMPQVLRSLLHAADHRGSFCQASQQMPQVLRSLLQRRPPLVLCQASQVQQMPQVLRSLLQHRPLWILCQASQAPGARLRCGFKDVLR